MKFDNPTKYPVYYDVDDVYVKIDFDVDKGEVFGLNIHGNPFPPLKAVDLGEEITAEKYHEREVQLGYKQR